MQTIDDAKAMAKRLRTALAEREIAVPHATALEIVAQELGFADWNTASAKLKGAPDPQEAFRFERVIPILRIFDETKAREFYCGFLGFQVDFEHRFEADLPLYLQVSRRGISLHLSEHHGDASPGATLLIPIEGIQALHKELSDKRYNYGRPGIVEQPWGDELTTHDPFGNRIRFMERRP